MGMPKVSDHMRDQTSKIRFRKNHRDNMHCFQACLSMVLSHFIPEQPDLTFGELDAISKKRPGKYTWPMHALMYLQSRGFDVIDFDMFDYKRFASEGAAYLPEYYGAKAGRDQIENSDAAFEQAAAGRYASSGINRRQVPTLNDVESLLRQGYMTICFVDAGRFTGSREPAGHYVLVTDISGGLVTLQDPGLYNGRGRENHRIDRDLFEHAQDYGDTGKPSFIAINRG